MFVGERLARILYLTCNLLHIICPPFMLSFSAFHLKKKKTIYLFNFGCAWVSIAALGLSLVAARGGCRLLQCSEFLLWWFLLLWCTGSRHTGFSSCSTEASLLHCMWDLPGPGTEPLSPELAGRFLTTRPPGKPSALRF